MIAGEDCCNRSTSRRVGNGARRAARAANQRADAGVGPPHCGALRGATRILIGQPADTAGCDGVSWCQTLRRRWYWVPLEAALARHGSECQELPRGTAQGPRKRLRMSQTPPPEGSVRFRSAGECSRGSCGRALGREPVAGSALGARTTSVCALASRRETDRIAFGPGSGQECSGRSSTAQPIRLAAPSRHTWMAHPRRGRPARATLPREETWEPFRPTRRTRDSGMVVRLRTHEARRTR